MGFSAAMYSSTLVGLMKRVASLIANGSKAHIPARQELRKLGVRALPEVVNVLTLGRVAASIFTTGPTSTICQSGMRIRHEADRAGIEALVDHAEESQSRMWYVPLLGMVERRVGARARNAHARHCWGSNAHWDAVIVWIGTGWGRR